MLSRPWEAIFLYELNKSYNKSQFIVPSLHGILLASSGKVKLDDAFMIAVFDGV